MTTNKNRIQGYINNDCFEALSNFQKLNNCSQSKAIELLIKQSLIDNSLNQTNVNNDSLTEVSYSDVPVSYCINETPKPFDIKEIETLISDIISEKLESLNLTENITNAIYQNEIKPLKQEFQTFKTSLDQEMKIFEFDVKNELEKDRFLSEYPDHEVVYDSELECDVIIQKEVTTPPEEEFIPIVEVITPPEVGKKIKLSKDCIDFYRGRGHNINHSQSFEILSINEYGKYIINMCDRKIPIDKKDAIFVSNQVTPPPEEGKGLTATDLIKILGISKSSFYERHDVKEGKIKNFKGKSFEKKGKFWYNQ